MSSMDRRTFLTSVATGAVATGMVASGMVASGSVGAAAACASTQDIAAPALMPVIEKYSPLVFENLKEGLDGISAGQIEEHLKLYNGYVNRTNALVEKAARMVASGAHLNEQKAPQPEYTEMKRRFGWEYNGMVLHEYYFQNLKKGSGDMPAGSPLAKAVEKSFGSVQNWWEDFRATSKSPGVGWVVTFQDARTKRIVNSWVSMHEEGNIAGFQVILALDLWEHAFVGDYKPTERGKYLAAFEKNIFWDVVNRRVQG